MVKRAELGRVARFLIVGGANTLLDFLLLFLLTAGGVPLWPANMVSTAAALVFSYFANRRFTFRDERRGIAQLLRFIAVTLVGLWVLQPLIMQGVLQLLDRSMAEQTALLVAKVCATVASLTWNFILYRLFVFSTEKGA